MRFDGMGWDGMGSVQVAIHFVMCVGIGLWGCVASVGSMYVWVCLVQSLLQKVAWARQDSLALDFDSRVEINVWHPGQVVAWQQDSNWEGEEKRSPP